MKKLPGFVVLEFLSDKFSYTFSHFNELEDKRIHLQVLGFSRRHLLQHCYKILTTRKLHSDPPVVCLLQTPLSVLLTIVINSVSLAS